MKNLQMVIQTCIFLNREPYNITNLYRALKTSLQISNTMGPKSNFSDLLKISSKNMSQFEDFGSTNCQILFSFLSFYAKFKNQSRAERCSHLKFTFFFFRDLLWVTKIKLVILLRPTIVLEFQYVAIIPPFSIKYSILFQLNCIHQGFQWFYTLLFV